MRILIADDAAFMRLKLKDSFEKAGYEVIGEAVDGQDAVQKYMQLKPDLVTMDITMPIKNGIEAIQEIISFDKKAKIIAVSAMGQESMIREAVVSGAKGFIVKPFKVDRLLEEAKKLAQS